MVVGCFFCFFFLSAFRTHLHSTFQNWSSASCSSVFRVCIIFLCLSIKFLIQHTVCYWSEQLKYAVLPWHTACQAGLLFSKLSWFYFERLGGKGGALGGVFFFLFFFFFAAASWHQYSSTLYSSPERKWIHPLIGKAVLDDITAQSQCVFYWHCP